MARQIGRTKKKKGKRGFKWFVLTLIILILAVVLVLGGIIFVKMGNLNTVKLDKDKLAVGDSASGFKNIVILGVDTRNMEDFKGRTDSIIIVSIDNKSGEVKLISVYRDTFLDIEEDGLDKVTHACAYGGPERTINTLNRNLDLNIEEFAAFNFKTVQKMVDEVGGVDINIEDDEVDQMNKYLTETAKYLGTEYEPIDGPGVHHLDGTAAVTYSRIRHTAGGDYKRTERMRTVFQAVFKEIKAHPAKINGIMDNVLPGISTNMSRMDIVPLMLTMARMDITDSIGWPYDKEGYTGSSGTWYAAPVTLKSNVIKLHQEAFGETDYEPSEEVVNLSKQIADTTGYYGE